MMLDREQSRDSTNAPAEAKRPWSGIVDRVRAMEYGSVVPTAALYGAAGIAEVPARTPGESDRRFAKRCEKTRMHFAGLLDKARKELLRVHKRDLRSTRPGEYQLVRPAEQADTAQRDALRIARQALSSGARRAEHVNTSALDDAQRRRASDVEAHLDSLRGLIRKAR